VGNWEYGDTFGFSNMYILPNGQIIIDDINNGANFHLIDSPDLQGLGCAFRFNGLLTTTVANSLPNMINYRLGALPGSPCDTLTGINTIHTQSIKVSVYPNPASDIMQVDVSNRDLSESISFVIYDMLGQEITRQNIPLYQIQINRNNISSGIYTWQIQNSTGQVKANGKMVWE
jgi:hypothetical protein